MSLNGFYYTTKQASVFRNTRHFSLLFSSRFVHVKFALNDQLQLHFMQGLPAEHRNKQCVDFSKAFFICCCLRTGMLQILAAMRSIKQT